MKKMVAGLLACMMLAGTAGIIQYDAPTSQIAFAAEQSMGNPLISRGVSAYSGSGTASHGNDDVYWTAWQSSAPDFLAYDLSGVPASQRRQVLAVWYNDSTYDNIGGYVNKGEEPIDYVIEVNSAAGGTYPNDGWENAVTVTGNGLSSRQHLVALNGANWIRLRVTKAEGGKVKLNFDIHDASNGVQDSWIFFGDSITAGGMGNSWGTSFASHIHALDSRFLPAAQNGGIGGITSAHGKAAIDGWLNGSPVKYVGIAYGTNDCWNNPNNLDSYYQNTKYMIDAVLKARKVPILPTIPYASDASAGKYTADYNAKVSQLYSEYGDKLLHGPDFYAFFKANPSLLSADGVHPSGDGYEAMRKLWAETMYENVYTKLPEQSKPQAGDVNADGSISVADAVLLAQYLLAFTDTLPDWQAADLDGNGYLNAADLTLLKRILLTEPAPEQEAFSAMYEAENARLNGANTVQNDAGASGGKAVGNFSGSSDTAVFTVSVPADGLYKLTVTAKGIGGNKTNNVSADGNAVGTFESGTSYTDSVLKGVMLSAGTHQITVSPSWGWIMLDKLTVETDEGIPKSVYNVSNKLINPNADAAAQKLFSYLCDSYGKYTLAGQVCNDGIDGEEFKAIHDVTGKYPAICGLDFMDYAPSRTARGARSNAVDTALKFHSQGGIVTFCWHWNAPDKYLKSETDANGNPSWWSGFSTSNVNFDIGAVMNGSDPEGKALIDADIAAIAKLINQMGSAGVPILWRPLHEASGGWFWWGAKGAEPYKAFWKYLYDQLTNVYHCNNLIWVWNGQAKDWYPGDEYVDIIGEDIYADAHSYGAQNAKFAELLEYPQTNKITALTENGVVFDIDNVVASGARWSWFGTWCGGFVAQNGKYSESYTEAAIMRKTYQSEYVITLDELPDFS
ncbi:MAG: GDSL-type esterase/lipase family protein [Oscillospiraceae bacterium]|nr:GDSL-type esterase/lipase family protein [Oscillospiraceae bacterium]